MKLEQKIRDFTLRLIQILTWFLVLWAVVFFVGMVFQWSGLTDQLSTAFFGSAFCAVVILLALAMLNVTANLNIISKAQVSAAAQAEAIEAKGGSFIKTICVAGALIALVVLSLWYAEWRLHRTKVAELETNMESLVGSSLFDEAVSLVKADGPARELATVREALAGTIQTGARLSFIIPRKTKDVTIYHEFTAWWYSKKDEDKTISEAGLARFTPRGPERRKWEKLIAGGIDRFTVPHGSNLRSFRRVVQNGQEIVLLIDTSRRSDYSRSSLK